MGENDLGADQKKARNIGATIVFADESGLMMAPLRRKGWSPVGKTPIIRQRTRSTKKISAMGAVAMSAKARRVRMFFRLLPNKNYGARECSQFITQLRQNIKGHIILVWDRLQGHRSVMVKKLVEADGKISIEFLPPYAPELNPVEYVWAWLKCHALANYAPTELGELKNEAKRGLCSLRTNRPLLKSVIKGSPLKF